MLANSALALDRAGAVFVYEHAKLYSLEQNLCSANFNAFFLSQNPLSVNWGSAKIKSDGGKVFLFNAKFPLDAGFATLTPHISFAGGNWRSGDFYHFYGKPDLPNASGFGMGIGMGGSLLGAAYYFGEANILNNENENLFRSDFQIWNVFYEYAAKSARLLAGFASANMDADGALTAANQRYFTFPYSFYNANGNLSIEAAYGIADLNFGTGSAIYALKLGGLLATGGEMRGNVHYKRRKFYGTDEVLDSINAARFKNNGLAFAVISLSSKKIKIGNSYFQYGVHKPFAVPFGETFGHGANSNAGKRNIDLRDIFFTMLTAKIDVWF